MLKNLQNSKEEKSSIYLGGNLSTSNHAKSIITLSFLAREQLAEENHQDKVITFLPHRHRQMLERGVN
jgi:hypothetical protein